MKRMLIMVFIIAFALSGCTSSLPPKQKAHPTASSLEHPDSPFQHTSLLTLNDVKNTLKEEGLQIKEIPEEDPDNYRIKNVTPAIYAIEPQENMLLVYIFKSIADRKEVCSEGGPGYINDRQVPQKDNWCTVTYTARNVLICDMMHQKIFQNYNLVFQTLKKVVISLNDCEKVVFADKGSYWDARLGVNYYQHWYKDNEDTTHVDQNATYQWMIKYLGPDPESILNVRYEYTSQSGSGKGNRGLERKGEDYYLVINHSGSNGMLNIDEVYDLIIQWDGQKEAFKLRRVKP